MRQGHQEGKRGKVSCRIGLGSAGCWAPLWRGLSRPIKRVSEAQLEGALVVGLQYDRQLKTGKDTTVPESPRTRFQEMEEVLGRGKE